MVSTFISYSSVDRPLALEVCKALEDGGIPCFIAPRDIRPGSIWAEQLVQAIRQAKVLVLLLSEHSNRSQHVLREMEKAVKYRRDIITFRVDEVTPSDGMAYFISVHHAIDARRRNDAETLKRLVAAVCDPPPARISPPPPLQSGNVKDQPVVAEPLLDEQIAATRWRLGKAMVREQDVIVAIQDFPPRATECVHGLLASDELREVRSPQRPGVLHVAFVDPRQSIRALASWFASQPASDLRQLLQTAQQFQPLADGMGLNYSQRWCRGDDGWIEPLIHQDYRSVERIVCRLLCELMPAFHPEGQIAGDPLLAPAEGGDKAELAQPRLAAEQLPPEVTQVNKKQDFELVHSALDRLLADGLLTAARGCARFAQELFKDSRQHAFAQGVFDKIGHKLQSRQLINKDSRPIDQCLAELDNEQGRLLRRRGELAPAEQCFRRAIAAAQRIGDEALLAVATNNVARVRLDAGDAQESGPRQIVIKLLHENLTRLQRLGQKQHLAVAYHNLGEACEADQPERAEYYFRRDCELCRELNDQPGLLDALDRLGIFYSNRGRFVDAVDIHKDELSRAEELFDCIRNARALANLGRALLGLGIDRHSADLLDQACARLEEARGTFLMLDEPQLFAPTLENLGRAHFAAGRCSRGIALLQDEACPQYEKWPQGRIIAEKIRAEINHLSPEMCED